MRKKKEIVWDFLILSLLSLLCRPCHAFSSNKVLLIRHNHYHHQENKRFLSCLNESNKKKGVYSRPSAAIERGSGFFIPGLEGGRVRVAFGILVGIANQFLSATTANSEYYTTSITITNIFVSLLLIQAGVEYIKDTSPTLGREGTKKRNSSSKSSSMQVDQYIAPSLLHSSETKLESMSWVASTLLALTPATGITILSSHMEEEEETPFILYQLSSTENENSLKDAKMTETTMKKYLSIISQSSSGRVSVPPEEGSSIKTIILQRMNDNMCIVLNSNQLLASFTKNDLKWLRKMADYIQ